MFESKMLCKPLKYGLFVLFRGGGRRVNGACLRLTAHLALLKCQLHMCALLVPLHIKGNLPLTFCRMPSVPSNRSTPSFRVAPRSGQRDAWIKHKRDACGRVFGRRDGLIQPSTSVPPGLLYLLIRGCWQGCCGRLMLSERVH